MNRIIHIISGDLWAGKEVLVFNLITRLKKMHSIEISVCLFNDGHLLRSLNTAGIPTHNLDEGKNGIVAMAKELRKIVSQFNPSILHCHGYKENMIGALAQWGHNDVKCVTTIHGLPERYSGIAAIKNRILSRLNILLLRRVFTAIICVSADIRRNLEHRLTNSKLIVIHNGVAIDEKRESGSRRERIFTVGSAGRLCAVKNFSLLIDICLEANKRADISFLLAGNGPQEAMLKEKVKALGLEQRFSFMGHVQDMGTFYEKIDLFVNTSHHEGIPITFLEAMMHRLPIVAPNTGGIPEIIRNGIDGLTIDGLEPDRFAEAILRMKNDPQFYRHCSGNSFERVREGFSIEHCVDEYFQLYSQKE